MSAAAEKIDRVVRHAKDVKVVSVDLFDTLVFRNTFDPLDVFYLQHARLLQLSLCKISPDAWVGHRKDVEHRLAREAAPQEVKIADVYEELRSILAWSTEESRAALEVELAIEADVIRPYDSLVRVLKKFRDEGIRIVVQTDTYLPVDFIRAILDNFLGFEYELRCSSETGKPKRSGLAFEQMKKDFGTSVIHFGDNHAVDVVTARKYDINAHHVIWDRARLLENSVQREYAAALGARRVLTPTEEQISSSLIQMAYRWSFVLTDFILSIRRYADEVGATDVWLLSRDAESIASVVAQFPGLLGDRTVKYVLCSRSSCLPIVALRDEARFRSWGYDVNEQVATDGEAALIYYKSQLTDASKRVLIVDTGWKGRLQVALSLAMPDIEVFGYYFSLEPNAEPDSVERAQTFMRWDLRKFNQPVIEALAGFVDASCARFVSSGEGEVAPVFKKSGTDRSPSEYCDALRAQMAVLIEGIMEPREERAEVRTRAVAQICAVPDEVVIRAFHDWRIGVDVHDEEGLDLLLGGSASRFDRLLMRRRNGNIWPQAAVWSVVHNPRTVQAIFTIEERIHALKGGIKRLMRRPR